MAALLFNSTSLLSYYLSRLGWLLKKHYNKLISVCHHVTLSQEDIGSKPVLIAGDIHGCFEEMVDLMEQAKHVLKGQTPYLVCAGDMLNKGPKSLEVLNLLRDMMSINMASAVKGNHEEAILKQFNMRLQDKSYVYPDRYQYLNDFHQDDFTFVERLPYSISIPHLNTFVVHAGLVPGIPLEEQSLRDLAHMRDVATSVLLPWGAVTIGVSKPRVGESVAWAQTWRGPQHVYFGHDCRRGLQQLPFATGLDTGCVYGDRLTGVLIVGGAEGWSSNLLSVPARCQHYRGKPGKEERRLENANADDGE